MQTAQRRAVTLLVTLLLNVALLFGWPNRAAAQGPNLLANPGFEYPFHASLPGKDNCFIANGWTGWYVNGTKEETDQGYLRAPEYKAATRHDPPFNRVRNGEAAQQWFGSFSTFRGGAYQVVGNVSPGARYRFEAWTMVWSCHFNSEKDAGNCAGALSGNPSLMRVRIGIDPKGGTDPFSGAIVWSGVHEPVDNWQLLQVETVAQSANITVFVDSNPEFRNRNNNVYVDDASLVMVSAPPTPRPQAASIRARPSRPWTSACPPCPTSTVGRVANSRDRSSCGSRGSTAAPRRPTAWSSPTACRRTARSSAARANWERPPRPSSATTSTPPPSSATPCCRASACPIASPSPSPAATSEPRST